MILKLDRPYPKQIEFFKSSAKYTAYGGARGGGKSWAARTKAILLALNYCGIQILFMRRTFPELKENHITVMQKILKGIARYKENDKVFVFPNASRIKMGYCDRESDVLQYQGQAYDVIFMEEATNFTEFQFQTLTESNRSSGLCKEKFSPRMYFTCNPGGVGHNWVKRLFIDRQYLQKEREEDYIFIKSIVYENQYIMENSPDYVRTLENLPQKRKQAMLHGDWDIFEGQYFTEFLREIHVMEPFTLPDHWRRYFVMDYGLDMFAGYFIALSEQNRAYVYKEIYESDLIVEQASKRIHEIKDEEIYEYLAPPDLWNRQKDSGKSIAELFGEQGIHLCKVSNDRVHGWMNLKEWLKPYKDEAGNVSADLKIFKNCSHLIRTLPALQHERKNPNDVAREPHEITHAPDALRYFIAARPTPQKKKREEHEFPFQIKKQRENPMGKGEKINVI